MYEAMTQSIALHCSVTPVVQSLCAKAEASDSVHIGCVPISLLKLHVGINSFEKRDLLLAVPLSPQ